MIYGVNAYTAQLGINLVFFKVYRHYPCYGIFKQLLAERNMHTGFLNLDCLPMQHDLINVVKQNNPRLSSQRIFFQEERMCCTPASGRVL